MYAITDCIIILLLTFYFIAGWCKGFLRILIGPIALTIGCIGGYFLYIKTQSFLWGLLVCVLGPSVINIVFSRIIKSLSKTKENEIFSFSLGRLMGASFNTIWRSVVVALLLVLIMVIPGKSVLVETIQKDVSASYSYAIIYKVAADRVPVAMVALERVIDVFGDPSKVQKFRQTREYRILATNKNFQNFMSDKKSTAQLENKNLTQLMANPKMHALLKDKEFLKSLFAFYQKVIRNDDAEGAGSTEDEEPKVRIFRTQ